MNFRYLYKGFFLKFSKALNIEKDDFSSSSFLSFSGKRESSSFNLF
jgi:hypothetical protein